MPSLWKSTPAGFPDQLTQQRGRYLIVGHSLGQPEKFLATGAHDHSVCRTQPSPTGLEGSPAQLSPAYECNPLTTMLMMNRLNSMATKPAALIQAALVSRQPEVARAWR